MKNTITIALLCASLLAGQSLTTVSDTIYLPVGLETFTGTIQIDAPALTYGGATYARQTKRYTVSGGVFVAQFVPNDAATPSGTSYAVRYYASGRQPWSEVWVVPTSSAALKINEVRTATVPSPSMGVSPSQLVMTPYAILYGSAAGAGLNLAPNTSTTPKYLRQVGDGTTAGVPTWTEVSGAACPTCLTSDGTYSNPTWLTALDWSKLLSVPSTFTPSVHTHAYSSLSDVPSTFAPSAHASSHGPSAADAVTLAQSQITGLADALAAKQAAISGAPASWPSFGDAALKNTGTGAGTVASGNDSRFTDARTPTAHAASHGSGQSDELAIAQSQVTGLETALLGKQDTISVSDISDIYSGIYTGMGNIIPGTTQWSEEMLAEGDFATAEKWDVTGDVSISGGKMSYMHSSGVGTLSQTYAHMAIPLPIIGEQILLLTYNSSGFSGDVACTLTGVVKTTPIALSLTTGAHTYKFISASAGDTWPDVVISCTSASGGVEIDDVSLKYMKQSVGEVKGGWRINTYRNITAYENSNERGVYVIAQLNTTTGTPDSDAVAGEFIGVTSGADNTDGPGGLYGTAWNHSTGTIGYANGVVGTYIGTGTGSTDIATGVTGQIGAVNGPVKQAMGGKFISDITNTGTNYGVYTKAANGSKESYSMFSAGSTALNVIEGNTYVANSDITDAEVFSNGSLTSGTGWSVSDDFTLGSDKATYTHSSGSGALYQLQEDFSTALYDGYLYVLTYTVSGITGTPICSIGYTAAGGLRALDLTAGTHTEAVPLINIDGFIMISCSSSSSATVSFDDLSLKRAAAGNVHVGGTVGASALKATGLAGVGTAPVCADETGALVRCP